MAKIKLEKYISSQSQHARRNVEELVAAKKVKVNGKVVKSVTMMIDSSRDSVWVDGEVLAFQSTKLYYKYFKPRGVITTMDDPKGRRHVGEVLKPLSRTLFPVGRLDRQSSGLLLVTNDGEFANHVMHPSFKCSKVYRVSLDRLLTKDDRARLLAGIFLEDGPVVFKGVDWVSDFGVDVEIEEGRNRIVRRAFEFLGYDVTRLHRTSIGPVSIAKLKPGDVVPMSPREIRGLTK